MIKIIDNKNIQWSVEDTFVMPVTSKVPFEVGDKLKFEISKSEDMFPIISKDFELKEDNTFDVILDDKDREKLTLGYYIYRIIISNLKGEKVTEQSGNFTVVWGV